MNVEVIVDVRENIQMPLDFETTAQSLIESAIKAHLDDGDYEVSILVVDDAEIHILNKEYRNMDAPTDVLSFALRDAPEDVGEVLEGVPELLGDIVISSETAYRQAVEYGHSPLREFAFLTVHGAMHLLGFDHQDEESEGAMRQAEEAILQTHGISR